MNANAGERAILNGFGRTIGDTLIGLTALGIAQRAGLWPVPTTLYRLPGLGTLIDGLHDAFPASVTRDLPWIAAAYGAAFAPSSPASVLDLRDFAYDGAFARRSMIDFFLERLGLDPASVPPAAKRNTWLAHCVRPQHSALPSGYSLLCPRANGVLRNMPKATEAALATALAAAGPVVTQGIAVAGTIAVGPADSLAGLCGLIAGARVLVSTDTGMIHLADALSVPTVAIFPTHDPAWRVRDYPHCRSIRLRSRLPPGLEFPRDDADLTLALAAWQETPDLMGQVETAVDTALADPSR